MKDHIFNRDASFIRIEQIRRRTLSRGTKKQHFLKKKKKKMGPETRDFKT